MFNLTHLSTIGWIRLLLIILFITLDQPLENNIRVKNDRTTKICFNKNSFAMDSQLLIRFFGWWDWNNSKIDFTFNYYYYKTPHAFFKSQQHLFQYAST